MVDRQLRIIEVVDPMLDAIVKHRIGNGEFSANRQSVVADLIMKAFKREVKK